MIDQEGFRPNVGIVIFNRNSQVLWARRLHQHTWQFPQGGVKEDETPKEAMYRELYEELGLQENDVYIVQTSRHWYRYRVPKRMLDSKKDHAYLGQKQRWFLLSLTKDDDSLPNISFNRFCKPEFDEWRWVSYWYPVRQVVNFKRDVYRKILMEFAPAALNLELKNSYN